MADSFRTPVNKSAGFTLLELLIVACIISILAAILLDRVQFYQKMAEKAAVEQTIGILRGALQLQFVSQVAEGRMDEVPKLVGQNPMQWLAQKPENYAGEYFDVESTDVTAGQWYFDLNSRELIYLVNNRSDVTRDVPVQLRFKTRLVFPVENFVGADRKVAGKVIEGVVLEQMVPYEWN